MNSDQVSGSRAESPANQPRYREHPWLFAEWLAIIGLVAGGSFVFHQGWSALKGSPPPPGTAACGNCVLGGVFLMLAAPFSGIICSLASGAVGGIVDLILNQRERSKIP